MSVPPLNVNVPPLLMLIAPPLLIVPPLILRNDEKPMSTGPAPTVIVPLVLATIVPPEVSEADASGSVPPESALMIGAPPVTERTTVPGSAAVRETAGLDRNVAVSVWPLV